MQHVNKSGCFSTIADESTDVSDTAQFSICARLVEKIDDEYIIPEDFLCFIPVEDVSYRKGACKYVADQDEGHWHKPG